MNQKFDPKLNRFDDIFYKTLTPKNILGVFEENIKFTQEGQK